MGVTVRSAREDDARAIADVHVRSWRTAYRGLLADETLDRLSVENRERSWRDIIAGRTRVTATLVAEIGDRLAGFCALVVEAGEAEIAALYVDPDLIRRGSGAALLGAALAHARKAGCRAAFLWVLPGNEAAIAFYERFGFRPDGGERVEEPTGERVIRLRVRSPEERGARSAGPVSSA